ncbi:hypothetical protein K1T71_010846 [Dendrolimus kikuchii]|uniref:Uncharacterized protein n=1 Tax=Dendrolimus kikuchii TaxID=765133 RepID=A0ACC1CR33_9NEOP|nr:hypothetical protein K1T71_010846 [Dendrolimus kikuchii]
MDRWEGLRDNKEHRVYNWECLNQLTGFRKLNRMHNRGLFLEISTTPRNVRQEYILEGLQVLMSLTKGEWGCQGSRSSQLPYVIRGPYDSLDGLMSPRFLRMNAKSDFMS